MICGNCKRKGDFTRDEVRDCFDGDPDAHTRVSAPVGQTNLQAVPPYQPPPQQRPFSTFQHMQPAETHSNEERFVDRYQSHKKLPVPPYKWPVELLEKVPDGYYAARLDDNDPYEFYRVSRPKKNKYAGCIKIQTQHGENWKILAVRWRDGNLWMLPYERGRFEEPFLMVLADHKHCQKLYAEKSDHCGRCNKALTDDRSLYYGIGPECEKYMPEYFAMIDDEKGVYSGPSGISA